MAGAFVGLVLDSVRNVSPGALLTLISLADRANKDKGGLAWPSLADMACRTNRQERQVRCDLRELEAAGWIRRCGAGLGGRGNATTYELNVPAMLHAMTPEKAAPHYREMRKLPGVLGPGFMLRATASNCANPAVATAKPGSQAQKPGTPLHETRHHTAPELEVNRNLEPEGFEPEALSPSERKKKGEPKSTVPTASAIGSSVQNRLSRKTPTPRVETEAEHIERLEAAKRRQLTPEVRAAMAAASNAGKA